MTDYRQIAGTSHLGGALAVITFAFGAFLAAALGAWVQHEQEEDAQAEFERSVESVSVDVARRLRLPINALKGARGLYAARGSVSRAEFSAYVESRDLPREIPGVRGLGFVRHVRRDQLGAFIKGVRADGAPGFAVHAIDAKPADDDLWVVNQIEPAASNPGTLGLDIGSEPQRRAAVQQAVDSGEPTFSHAIVLVQDERRSPGMLAFVPVYANGQRPASVAQRRAALVGVLVAPIVLAELLDGLSEVNIGHVSVELFDASEEIRASNRLYAAGPTDPATGGGHHGTTAPHRSTTLALQVPGREFALRVRCTPSFDASFDSSAPWLVSAGGVLTSALLALVLWLQASGRQRAERLAQHMTGDVERLAKVVQHTSSAVTLTDAELRITWVNEGFTRISGYRLDEALGRTPGSLLSGPNSNPAALRTLAEAAAAGRECVVDVLNRAKNGRDYWFHTEVQPLHDEHGRLVGFMEIGDDVTERHLAQERLEGALRENAALLQASKASEAALRASQDRLRRHSELMTSVLENLPCAVSVFDSELNLVVANRLYRQLLELPDALFDATPTRLEDLIRHGVERGEYGACDAEAKVQALSARARPPVQAHQFERRRSNGTWLEVRGAPMPGGGLITTYTDVTARHAAEAEVRRSAQLLRGAIETIDEAFVLYDPDDRLVFCNEKYRRVYAGVADRIVPGARFEDIIRAGAERGDYLETVGRVDEWVVERLAAHRAGERTLIQKLIDGRTLRIVERRMPDGHTVGFRIDITELVRATEAAQDAARAKGQFLANMSHEIRTPMNAILGMLTLLGRTELSARQADYVDKARGAAQALLELLNDILDFSKVEAGGLTLDPHPFRVDQLVHDVYVIAAGSVGTKPLVVCFDVDAEVPACLVGDAMRLKQVLINLAGNAIKFTPEGEVTVQLTLLARHAGHDGEGDRVTVGFAVRDTGIGIAPEHLPRIFTGFTQAEASTTRRFGGTGLGLAISQRLVALMGAELEVDSAPGRGSRFHFRLTLPVPAADWDAPVTGFDGGFDAPAGQPQRLAGLRLLVAEDNPNNQQVARELLEAEGALVQIAADGAEAVQAVLRTLAQARPGFDAVLMDVQMPELDGCEATREIRRHPALAALPIVAMTANAFASDRDACLAAGMSDHVAKPFEIDHLVQVLRLHTGRAAAAGRPLAGTASRLPVTVNSAAQAAGVNLEVALHRLGGRHEIYQRMLRRFVADLEAMPAQLQAQLASGQFESMARALHTLKGLAGTLGATALAREAERGQSRLAAARADAAAPSTVETTIAALSDAVRRSAAPLDRLSRALQGARFPGDPAARMESEPTSDAGAARSAAATTALRVLAAQLRDADMGATDTSTALLHDFGALLGETLRHLNDAVLALDFDRALPLCENLLRSMPTAVRPQADEYVVRPPRGSEQPGKAGSTQEPA